MKRVSINLHIEICWLFLAYIWILYVANILNTRKESLMFSRTNIFTCRWICQNQKEFGYYGFNFLFVSSFLPSPQTVSDGVVCLRKFHWLLHNILIINTDKFLQRGRILIDKNGPQVLWRPFFYLLVPFLRKWHYAFQGILRQGAEE